MISFCEHAKVWSNSTVNMHVMKISEFETKTGLSRDTIRYYEGIGLLPSPRRSENGYKIYTKSHLATVKFIEEGKAIGFSLKAIKVWYERYQALGYLCPEFKAQLLAKKADFELRIKHDKSTIAKIEKMLGG